MLWRAFIVSVLALSGCGGARGAAPVPAADESIEQPVVIGSALPGPPTAPVHPYQVESPHGNRSDPYYWLRDDTRKDPRVLDYLKYENNYTDAYLAPTEKLQKTLYDEMIARLKEDDASVPTLDNGFVYYSRFEKGKQYPIHARKRAVAGQASGDEEVLLDVNDLAAGHDFYRVGHFEVSTNNKLLAYTEDTVGRNKFRLRIKNLETGELLPDTADNISEAVVWGNGNSTVFYIEKHPQTLLGYRVRRHVLGGKPGEDALVYEETDSSFYIGLSKSKSKKFIVVDLNSTVTSEARLIDADKPAAPPAVFWPRQRDHEYSVDHLNGRFVVRSNWGAKNFRVLQIRAKRGLRSVKPVAAVASKRSSDLVAPSSDVFVNGFALFDEFIAVSIRSGGLRKIRVIPNKGKPFVVDAEEPAYTMYLSDLPESASAVVRYSYLSLTTPQSVYELDVATGTKTLLKRDPVLGDFDSANYVTEYLHATARDGTKVPVSIVYRKGLVKDGTAPLLQYGYGSYGASMDPSFRSTRLSLLDRGFIWAIAHIRGGQEMGRTWYEDGKLLKKKNSFTDFVAVTDYLVQSKYAAADKVFAMGGSAGGLLMGAIANMAPEKYRGVIAAVPFVDVVTTMLDETIPLTTNEFDEWGNPKDKAYYDYMLSYSPYDQVSAQAYPSMLVTTGLWDSQVQYFEPAKWVAKLRSLKTDHNPLLLHTNMDAGHGGKSGRYRRYLETARDYAFILQTLDRPDAR